MLSKIPHINPMGILENFMGQKCEVLKNPCFFFNYSLRLLIPQKRCHEIFYIIVCLNNKKDLKVHRVNKVVVIKPILAHKSHFK